MPHATPIMAAQTALTADNGGYGDDVVGVGGVPHTENEAQKE